MPSIASGPDQDIDELGAGNTDVRLEAHRRELTGFCYRMLASPFDAEDAVQDTMVRAWRAMDRFDGRSSLRTWLYRIATNVCLDMLAGRQRRALPMELGPSSPPVLESLGSPLPVGTWIEPVPDARVVPESGDPAELAVARESVRMAFVAALQHLPARQRAVLILRDVLRWKADEVAELLDTSVASANSALQRARATMAASKTTAPQLDAMDDDQRALLARYVEAFERYDIESLVSLLHEDATQAMPPYQLWLQGAVDVGRWHLGPGIGCRGSRLLPVLASGLPGFGAYKPNEQTGELAPWSIQVVEISGGLISHVTHFLEPPLFPLFGLPPRVGR
jgi:RNA polymerase sigma-70 factor (ECF subfamily)